MSPFKAICRVTDSPEPIQDHGPNVLLAKLLVTQGPSKANVILSIVRMTGPFKTVSNIRAGPIGDHWPNVYLQYWAHLRPLVVSYMLRETLGPFKAIVNILAGPIGDHL